MCLELSKNNMTLRQDKVAEVLRVLGSEFLSRVSNRTSLITITRADVSRDMKKATLYVTVYPETEEENALNFVKRNRSDLRDYVKPKLSMKSIPFFDFVIDEGEKNRQHLDELSHDL